MSEFHVIDTRNNVTLSKHLLYDQAHFSARVFCHRLGVPASSLRVQIVEREVITEEADVPEAQG